MSRIISHLWYDKEAREAAELYVSAFPDSRITNVNVLHNTPSGDCDIVSFILSGREFMAISAGPYFKFNPSISFQVKCATKEEVDELWQKLSPEGSALMELGSYPFSERFGWLGDRFGLSWQLMYDPATSGVPRISPFLLFVGKACGKAEEAVNFYASIFRNSKATVLSRYGKQEAPEKEGTVRTALVTLDGVEFGAMDSAHGHAFAFNEAISFLVNCETQQEIDYYWEKLSADPASEQCGWVKDKYGVSWQIHSSRLGAMLLDKNPKKVDSVTRAFLTMKKFDLRQLEDAYKAG
jgi:predicted 3-demethylubiquinone-9 3-methyltransferase (glyoxalase superfamily)